MLESRILQSNVIKLMSGVPLEPSMTKQFYFANQTERELYFSGKTIYTISDAKYIRDSIRVQKNQSELFNINYMCFINTSVSEPPIYCYVTGTEYINPNVSQINYEVDVWTTYMFNIRLHDCDIAREHPPVGYAYNYNTVPEGLPFGDHYCYSNYLIDLDNADEYIIVSSCDLLESAGTIDQPIIVGAKGDVVGSIPTACAVYAVTNATSSLYNIMSALSNFPWVSQSIISIFPYPISALGHDVTVMQSAMGFSVGLLLERNAKVKQFNINWKNNFPAYKEKKLLTYPYSFIELAGPNGSSCILKPELLNNDMLNISVWGAVTEGSLIAHVNGYSNVADYSYASVLFGGLASIPVQNNQYIIAKSQASSQIDLSHAFMKENLIYDMIGGVVSGAVNSADGGAYGVAGGVMGSLITSSIDVRKAQQTAEKDRLSVAQMQSAIGLAGKGATGAGLVMYARRQLDFFVRFWTIRDEWKTRLENYFDAFGLKTIDIKTPNVKTRPRYNYIRCNSVNIEGDCEQEAIEKIRNMFLNGVTFWHDVNNVGVYGNNG